MAAESKRTARIEARIPPEALEVIRRAAEIQGRSVNAFVAAAAQEAAQRAVSEVEVLKLSSNAQEHFISLLLNPPKPTAALGRAFTRHRALTRAKRRAWRMTGAGPFTIEARRHLCMIAR